MEEIPDEEEEFDLSAGARNEAIDNLIATTTMMREYMRVMAEEDDVDLKWLDPDPHDLQLRLLDLLKQWNVAVEQNDTETMARVECAVDAERCAFMRALDEAEARDGDPSDWEPYDHPADVAPLWVP